MTPEAQRIAIAEVMGEINVRFTSPGHCIASSGQVEGRFWGTHGVPDYLNDLNAMQSAVMSLDGADRISFAASLYDVSVPQDDRFKDHFIGWPQAELMINATAAQRAEAFLKTINKWTE
jgi:hypothetical protein